MSPTLEYFVATTHKEANQTRYAALAYASLQGIQGLQNYGGSRDSILGYSILVVIIRSCLRRWFA